LDVERWAKRVEMDVARFCRIVALKLHDRIVERTPVDTGRARASWTIVEGYSPDLSVAPEGFQGGASAAAAVQAARRAQVKEGFAYVIANNLPYIVELENGSSKQAPHGMVRVAIADVKTELQAELGS
jgi:hypothetical protein